MNDKLEWIERYLDQILSEQEHIEFKNQLAKDSELQYFLAERLKLQKLWNDTKLYEDIRNDVRDALNYKNKKFISKWIKIYSIAASLVIFIGLGSILIFTKQNILQKYVIASHKNINADSLSIENFKINELEAKARHSIYTGVNEIDLLHPKDNQSIGNNQEIIFSWRFIVRNSLKDTLYIYSLPRNTLCINEVLSTEDTIYILDKGILTLGKYSWTIGRLNQFAEFIIE